MKPNLLNVFDKSSRDLVKNPLIIIPSVILAIVLFLLGKLSWKMQSYLLTNTLLTLWLVIFSLVTIAIMSYLFCALIGASQNIVKTKSIRGSIKTANKYWWKNYPIMILLALAGFIAFQIALLLGTFIGKSAGLDVSIASVIFFIILFACLAGGVIFLTFSSFYLIVFNKRVFESIKLSAKTVKNNYLQTFSIIIIFFIIYSLIQFLSGYSQIAAEVIEYVLVTPYLALVLTRFIISLHELK